MAERLSEFADHHDLDSEELESEYQTIRQKLWEARAPRAKPGLDDKVL